MSKRSISDSEKSILAQVLTSLNIPESVIIQAISEKGYGIYTHYQDSKDFLFKSDGKDYLFPFSAIKVSEFSFSDGVMQQEQPKKKGRGKAKKTTSRTSFTLLVDSSDMSKLDAIATTKDLSVAYLVRLAIKNLLDKGIK